MVRLIISTAALIGLAVLYYSWPDVLSSLANELNNNVGIWAHEGIGALFWILFGFVIQRTLKIFLWEGWFARRSDVPVPKVLIDMTGLLIWVAILFATLAHVFHVNVSALVTTSGVTIAVIGFALRNMIADVFTGIALGIERPLKTGDWIELEDGSVGRVIEVNWRATRILTRDEVVKVVPNSFLATHLFANYHAPEEFFRDKFEIVLGYEVSPDQAERILLSAVCLVPESTRIPRKPEVRITDYTARGIQWELRYWVPNYPAMSRLRHDVQINVLKNLQFAGVRMPRNSVDYLDLNQPTPQPDTADEDMGFLRKVDLFAALDTNELGILRKNMRRIVCVAGTPVVSEDAGSLSSLLIVKEGFLEVSIKNGSGEDTVVAGLAAGEIFGEMSLLTGAPPSATVTPTVAAVLMEITHDGLKPLLKARQELVVHLGAVVAERQMRNDKSLNITSRKAKDVEQEKLTARIVSGIINFFGLHEKS